MSLVPPLAHVDEAPSEIQVWVPSDFCEILAGIEKGPAVLLSPGLLERLCTFPKGRSLPDDLPL